MDELAKDLTALHSTVAGAQPEFYFSAGPDGLALSMSAELMVFCGVLVAVFVVGRLIWAVIS